MHPHREQNRFEGMEQANSRRNQGRDAEMEQYQAQWGQWRRDAMFSTDGQASVATESP